MPEENTGIISTLQAEMAEIKAEISALKVEIQRLKVEKVERKGGKGGKERWKGHSFKSADDPYIDPSFDPGDPGGTPQTPHSPDDADWEMWQTAVDLVERWKTARGTYRRLDPEKPRDADDYFRPLLGLVVQCDGDGGRAWDLLDAAYQRMVADGLTPVRAGPVVEQIFTEQQREEMPPPQANGHYHSPAEAAALNYARLKQEFSSHE